MGAATSRPGGDTVIHARALGDERGRLGGCLNAWSQLAMKNRPGA